MGEGVCEFVDAPGVLNRLLNEVKKGEVMGETSVRGGFVVLEALGYFGSFEKSSFAIKDPDSLKTKKQNLNLQRPPSPTGLQQRAPLPST